MARRHQIEMPAARVLEERDLIGTRPPAAAALRKVVEIPDDIVLAQVATYVLTPGEFERNGRQVVPGTYQAVEAEPLPALTFLTAVPRGLAEAQDIIFFVFIVGGVVAVIRATGTVDAVIGTAIQYLGDRPTTLVLGMMMLFALGSSTIGMAEEYLPFVPILVTMCLALKMDAVVAVGIIYIGAGIGYGCAALNPFTVLIAEGTYTSLLHSIDYRVFIDRDASLRTSDVKPCS